MLLSFLERIKLDDFSLFSDLSFSKLGIKDFFIFPVLEKMDFFIEDSSKNK